MRALLLALFLLGGCAHIETPDGLVVRTFVTRTTVSLHENGSVAEIKTEPSGIDWSTVVGAVSGAVMLLMAL